MPVTKNWNRLSRICFHSSSLACQSTFTLLLCFSLWGKHGWHIQQIRFLMGWNSYKNLGCIVGGSYKNLGCIIGGSYKNLGCIVGGSYKNLGCIVGGSYKNLGCIVGGSYKNLGCIVGGSYKNLGCIVGGSYKNLGCIVGGSYKNLGCIVGGSYKNLGCIVGGSCHKYHFCCDKHMFVTTKQEKYACRDKSFDKHTFVAIKYVVTNICRNKDNLVAIKLLSWQACFCHDKYVCHDKTHRLWQQKYACCNETFVVTKLYLSQQQNCRDKGFVVTNLLLWDKSDTCASSHQG